MVVYNQYICTINRFVKLQQNFPTHYLVHGFSKNSTVHYSKRKQIRNNVEIVKIVP